MAIQLQRGERDPQKIVDSIIQLNNGRANNVNEVTLTPGATSTTVSFVNCSAACQPVLMPHTANAAAAVSTTYVSAIGQGFFTITHANNAQADRTFGFACIGG